MCSVNVNELVWYIIYVLVGPLLSLHSPIQLGLICILHNNHSGSGISWPYWCDIEESLTMTRGDVSRQFIAGLRSQRQEASASVPAEVPEEASGEVPAKFQRKLHPILQNAFAIVPEITILHGARWRDPQFQQKLQPKFQLQPNFSRISSHSALLRFRLGESCHCVGCLPIFLA
jgi:hypothetical protein